MRHPAAQPHIAVRGLQEIHDLRQLPLRLVDPGHVVERHPQLRRIHPTRLRAPEIAEPTEPPSTGLSPACEKPEQADQEQRRAEPEQDLAHQRGPGVRILGVDLDAPSLKLGSQRGVVPERRDLGREQRGGRGRPTVRRVEQLARERPVDRGARGGDRFHLAGLNLLKEVRAERNLHSRLPRWLGHQNRQPVDRQQHKEDDPERAHPVRRTRLVLLGHPAPIRRRRYPPAALAPRHRRRRHRLVGLAKHASVQFGCSEHAPIPSRRRTTAGRTERRSGCRGRSMPRSAPRSGARCDGAD